MDAIAIQADKNKYNIEKYRDSSQVASSLVQERQ
jgi:hypothetical protein